MDEQTAYEQGREDAYQSFHHWYAEDGAGYDDPDEYRRGVADEILGQTYGEDTVIILNEIRNADIDTLAEVFGVFRAGAKSGGLIDSVIDGDDETARRIEKGFVTLLAGELRRRGQERMIW